MLALRVLAVVIAAAFAMPASAVVYPYQGVGIGGDNNVYDLDLTMCTGPNGCIDINFKYCKSGLPNSKANPNTPCEVRAVPALWCANGTNAPNQFDAASGTCSPGTPALGTIRCGSPADCPNVTDSCLGANLAAQCTNATATAICGATPQARCSDGDPEIRYGDSNGVGLCTHTIIGSSVEPTNCGKEGGVTVSSATGGPRYAGFENASSAVTPQRSPGTGLSTVGLIIDADATYALEITAPDAYGVRQYKSIGKSFWADWGYADKSVGGGAVSAMLPAHPFNGPNGWQTQNLIGVCASGTNNGTLCLSNGVCTGGGTCGSFAGPYTYAVDEVGYIWTTNIDPNTAPDTCPPECGLDYDFSTFESEALNALTAKDVNAGRQLSLDSLTKTGASGIAGAGDALGVAQVWTFVFLDADARCYVGGDPARIGAGFPAKIGICADTSGSYCDPATETGNPGSTNTTNDCVPTILCEYCGGRHSSLSAPNGGASALPVGYDDQSGNCAGGFDCSGLAITGRTGGRNNNSFNIQVPLTLVFTTGYARAEVRDAACGTLGIPSTSTCLLGGATGAVGIGSGGTYTVGQVFAAGGTCCGAGGVDLSWSAVSDGAAIAGHNGPVATGDFNPGTNGIPGCIGDNQNGDSAPPCAVGGGGKLPGTGSPGTDDPARYAVVLTPAGPALNASSPPRVDMSNPADRPIPNASDATPTLRMVSAGSVTDLEILGTDNNDSLFKVGRIWCPVKTVGGVDCFYDPDGDTVDEDDDNCPGLANTSQANADGDAKGDLCDNCVTVSNSAQTNSDADALGDACDTCTNVSNGTVVALGFQTTTGGQLDDDADGYGQPCDGDFNQAKNKVDSADLDLFKVAFNKNRNGLGPDCNPAGTAPCDKYDMDNSKSKIDSADLAVFKALFNLNKGPKCPTCPLTCAGDACP